MFISQEVLNFFSEQTNDFICLFYKARLDFQNSSPPLEFVILLYSFYREPASTASEPLHNFPFGYDDMQFVPKFSQLQDFLWFCKFFFVFLNKKSKLNQ